MTAREIHQKDAYTLEKLFNRQITYIDRFGHGTPATNPLLNEMLRLHQKIIMAYGDDAYFNNLPAFFIIWLNLILLFLIGFPSFVNINRIT